MKKLIALALCAIMLVSFSLLTASAASELDANEQAIMDALREKVTLGDVEMVIPEAYFTYVENYFRQDGVALTEQQAAAILDEIAAAKETIKDGGELAFDDMAPATRAAVLENIEAAAEAIDLVAEFDVEDKEVTILDQSGAPVLAPMDVTEVKATGSSVDMTAVILASISVVVAFGLCVVIAKKAKSAAAA